MKSAQERLFASGYQNPKLLYGFDNALIGVDTQGRAVYDYDLMIRTLIENESMDYDEAVSWIEENTLGVMAPEGEDGPVVVEILPDVEVRQISIEGEANE